jgi:hypothetical protein
MGTVRITDVMIWAKQIEGDDELVALINCMEPHLLIELEINGFKGFWQKTNQNPEHQTGHALKPRDCVKQYWKILRSQGQKTAEIRQVKPAR